MDLSILVPIIGIPVVRGVAGWIQNALEDGKIDKFEWAKLGETIVRIGVIGAGTYFGLNGMGMDVSALGAFAGAMILDIILGKIER